MVDGDVKAVDVGEAVIVIESVRMEVVSLDVVVDVVLVGTDIVTGTDVG